MPPYLEGEELKKLMQEVDLLLEHCSGSLNDHRLAFLSQQYRRYEQEILTGDKIGMGFSDKQLSWLEHIIREYDGSLEDE
jgi:hypothetical protein